MAHVTATVASAAAKPGLVGVTTVKGGSATTVAPGGTATLHTADHKVLNKYGVVGAAS